MFSGAFIFLAILIIILIIWIRWRMNKTNFFRKYGIPGPKPHFLTGNLIEFLKTNEKCVPEWIGKYGKTVGFFLGGMPCIICTDLNLLKLIQIKEYKKFAIRSGMLPDAGVSDPTFNHNVFLKQNEEWKTARSTLSTSFSTGKIKLMTTLLSKPIYQLFRNIDKKKGQPFDILDMFGKLSFDIACRTEFGVETNIQNEESNTFTKSLFSLFKVDSNTILRAASVLFPELEPIPTKLRSAVDFIKHKMNLPCARVVFETARKILQSRKTSNIRYVDLLQNMIDAEDESIEESYRFSEDCILATIVSFMIAGIEGTSAMLGMIIHYISLHQEVQEKLREEIMNNTEKCEEIQYSDLAKFKYMDQVLSEAIRFLPLPMPAVNRVGIEDFKYKDVIIPKNVPVMIPLSILHKDPLYWNNPEVFDPERFSPSNIANIDNIVYQPFGAGPRHCIGKQLGQIIVKLMMANLIRSYRFELHGDKKLEITHNFFLPHPKNGIVVRAFPIGSYSSNHF